MRWNHAAILLALASVQACDGSDDPSSKVTDGGEVSDDVAGLWRFSWLVEGKDDADILLVQLDQAGKSVTGKGCQGKYEESSGKLMLASVTCDGEAYDGELEGSRLSLEITPKDEGDGAFTLDLQVKEDGAKLEGAANGQGCNPCEVTATRAAIGDPS